MADVMKNRVGTALVAIVAGAIGTAIARFGVYEALIVPRLANWVAIPFGWWAFAFAPVVVSIVSVTFWLRERWFAIGAFASLGIISVFLAADIYDGARGTPVLHDTLFASAEYFGFLGFRFALIFVFSVLVAWLSALPTILRSESAA